MTVVLHQELKDYCVQAGMQELHEVCLGKGNIHVFKGHSVLSPFLNLPLPLPAVVSLATA